MKNTIAIGESEQGKDKRIFYTLFHAIGSRQRRQNDGNLPHKPTGTATGVIHRVRHDDKAGNVSTQEASLCLKVFLRQLVD